MKIHSEICVIGNGAVGKATALALAQAGFDVVLLAPAAQTSHKLESAEDRPWDMRVYALNHMAQALLSSLKVWSAMDLSRVAPVDAMLVRGEDSGGLGQLSFDAYGARVGVLAWIVEDSNLNVALDAALRFASGLRVISATATALKLATDDAAITLDNGDVIETSLVVGADGAQSWVRGQCEIGLDYRSYNQQAVVANFACEFPHHGVASQWFLGADGIVALLPLPGQRVSLVWSAPDALAASLLHESVEKLAERLMALPDQKLGQMSLLPPAAPKAIPLKMIRTHSAIAHRVALVGDAAHVVHPLAGQGMNLGFADVDALLSALAKRELKTECGDARTLGRYARSRKEDVALMHLAMDGLQRFFASELPPVRALRNAGLGLIDRIPFLKRRLIAHALGKTSLTNPEERWQ
ncbi:MAG: FAD-dependent monooxygenase [Burkholderiaceae bacterium]